MNIFAATHSDQGKKNTKQRVRSSIFLLPMQCQPTVIISLSDDGNFNYAVLPSEWHFKCQG